MVFIPHNHYQIVYLYFSVFQLVSTNCFSMELKYNLKMAVVYNYFEPIPIPDPENPKFTSPESAKHVQSPKELKREKHR